MIDQTSGMTAALIINIQPFYLSNIMLLLRKKNVISSVQFTRKNELLLFQTLWVLYIYILLQLRVSYDISPLKRVKFEILTTSR